MRLFVFAVVTCFLFSAKAEQRVDSDYQPKNKEVTFSLKNRPVVLVDSAHHNFHTISNRYKPFANVLESDGYLVKANKDKFDEAKLADVNILVIANALSDKNIKNWDLPNYSAFTRKEVETIYHWVNKGGSLFLIADHMPWPKAAADLAEIFGFHFQNGYVEVLGHTEQYFELSDNSLAEHSILKGLIPEHEVVKVRGFMGQGFLSPPSAQPVMVFRKPSIAYMPSQSFEFKDTTPTISATNWHQLATLNVGKGRIVVAGEAGMFTAQIDSDKDGTWHMGLNAKGAEQNERLLLNIMLWLSGKLT